MLVKLRNVLVVALISSFVACNSSKIDPSNPSSYPVYSNNDLGLTYSHTSSAFKVWAPTAKKVVLRLYNKGLHGEALLKVPMKKKDFGVWQVKLDGDFKGKYYTFQAKIDNDWLAEVPGPYAKATGANGRRAQIIDPNNISPEGWETDTRPTLKSSSDIILYELHVRDFSNHITSGIQHKGKYLAFTQENTKTPYGNSSGLDHLKELGITHVHLLPSFDYRSIDEETLDKNEFNWGYDPQNYNVPEGSYSTNPHNGEVRIMEFKKMVQALHKAGIRVVMDVVYNHVGSTQENSFDQLVPGYYFRYNNDGSFSNASGCGNETASEHPMMQKFIIESLKFWAQTYHIDGFRFDLMGIHDIETMNMVARELKAIDPSIFIYGEGWTAGASPLPTEKQAIKANTPKLKGVAIFSDEMRDGIKGHWNKLTTKGFISGEPLMEESVKFGIVGAIQHPQIDYNAVNYSDSYWATNPTQCINYVSCHDNNTLFDKLSLSVPDASTKEKQRMAKLANTIVLSSQGVPFLHAGVEFYRTKQLVENSYNAPDSINNINWAQKDKYLESVEFYKGLIKMRKEHPIFKLGSTEHITNYLEFMNLEPNVIGYTLTGTETKDSWQEALVLFNANKSSVNLDLGPQNWQLAFDLDKGYMPQGKKYSGNFKVEGVSAYIFYRN